MEASPSYLLLVACVFVINTTLTLFIAFIPKGHTPFSQHASNSVLLGFILFSLAWLCMIYYTIAPSLSLTVATNVLGMSAYALLCAYPWYRCQKSPPILLFSGLWVLGCGVMIWLVSNNVALASRLHAFNSLMLTFTVIASIPTLRSKQYRRNMGDQLYFMTLWINSLIFSSRSLAAAFYEDSESFITYASYVGSALLSAGLGGSILISFLFDIRNDLFKQSVSDSMTGLLNRRGFVADSEKVLSASNRHHYPVSVVICDLDLFKNVNDNFGHQVGDQALKAFSKIITDNLRNEDIAARIGGEEFIIILPHTRGEVAIKVAERIRQKTEQMSLDTVSGPLTLTASFGVTQFNHIIDLDTLIRYADSALYGAKNNGRNQVYYSVDGENASPALSINHTE